MDNIPELWSFLFLRANSSFSWCCQAKVRSSLSSVWFPLLLHYRIQRTFFNKIFLPVLFIECLSSGSRDILQWRILTCLKPYRGGKTYSLYYSECFAGWVNTEGWNNDNHIFTGIRLFLWLMFVISKLITNNQRMHHPVLWLY